MLALANVAFLASFCAFDPRRLIPFAVVLVIGYGAMRAAEGESRRSAAAAGVLVLLAAYAVVKRYTFVPGVLLPPDGYVAVGISYVIFRLLHLVVDASQKALPERVSAIAFVSYTLNFTALVSGPIQLYGDYRKTEFERPLVPSAGSLAAAFYRITLGCFKVLALSPPLAALQADSASRAALGGEPLRELGNLILAVATFAPYVYVNFSGYTDIVLGVARFLGLELPENFNAPFAATGYLEFWTRWHMSLSNWLKRYVYTPLLLVLMRRNTVAALEPWFAVVAYFVAFFLIGVWHGRTSEFLFFGLLQGIGVSANKVFQMQMTARLGKKGYRETSGHPAFAALSRAATFTWFSLSLIWFWGSWQAIGKLVETAGPALAIASLAGVFALAAAVFATRPLVSLCGALAGLASMRSRPSPYVAAAICALMFVSAASAALLTAGGTPHLVYRAF